VTGTTPDAEKSKLKDGLGGDRKLQVVLSLITTKREGEHSTRILKISQGPSGRKEKESGRGKEKGRLEK